MNKFRYNDATERMKRVNRVYLLAVIILFGVLTVYQTMLVKEGGFPAALESNSRNAIIITLVLDAVLYFFNKSGKLLRVCVSAM